MKVRSVEGYKEKKGGKIRGGDIGIEWPRYHSITPSPPPSPPLSSPPRHLRHAIPDHAKYQVTGGERRPHLPKSNILETSGPNGLQYTVF